MKEIWIKSSLSLGSTFGSLVTLFFTDVAYMHLVTLLQTEIRDARMSGSSVSTVHMSMQ